MNASCSAAISLLFAFLLTHSNYAAIEGFVETFSGTETSGVQPLTGFDNDGWLSAGDATIQDGQLIIINEPASLEEGVDIFRRDGVGFGSFRETIRFTYLDLGNYNGDTRPSVASNNFVRLRQSFIDEQGERIASFSFYINEHVDHPLLDDDTQLLIFGEVTFQGKDTSTRNLARKTSKDQPREFGFQYDADNEWVDFWYDDDLSQEGHTLDMRIDSIPNFTAVRSSSWFSAVAADRTIANATIDEWILEPLPEPLVGDFDQSGVLDVSDIDLLSNAIQTSDPDTTFDLTRDGITDSNDLEFWLHELFQTYFGDSNLDGEFNSADLVSVFVAGEYEDAIEGNSTWATGDWSGNGEFDSADLVLAFQDGGYELGPREAVRSVPEPNETGVAVLFGFLIGWLVCRRRFVA